MDWKVNAPMSNREMQILLDNCKRFRDRIIFELLYHGPRVGDLLGSRYGGHQTGLLYHNINWEENQIRLQVKGGKIIDVVVHSTTMNKLRLYCQERKIKKGKIFKISRIRVNQIIKEIVHEFGLRESISSHDFRHTAGRDFIQGTHLIFNEANADTRHVQEQLGHSDIRTTACYEKLVTADRKKAFGV